MIQKKNQHEEQSQLTTTLLPIEGTLPNFVYGAPHQPDSPEQQLLNES
jgi:hypothetical protein